MAIKYANVSFSSHCRVGLVSGPRGSNSERAQEESGWKQTFDMEGVATCKDHFSEWCGLVQYAHVERERVVMTLRWPSIEELIPEKYEVKIMFCFVLKGGEIYKIQLLHQQVRYEAIIKHKLKQMKKLKQT